MGTSHPLSVGSNNHAFTANPNATGAPYANIAARDADSAFHGTSTNVDKVVKVTDADGSGTVGYFILVAITPTWESLGASLTDSFLELNDTPSTYSGQSLRGIRVNVGETGLEFIAGGAVSGPGSSTDNALTRWDGTAGNLLQNSLVILDDVGVMSGLTQLTVDNLRLDGNTLSSQDTNGNILIDPDGTGFVDFRTSVLLGIAQLNVDSVRIDGETISTLSGNLDLILSPNGTGLINVTTRRIINVVDPTSAQDAVTKNYADTNDAFWQKSGSDISPKSVNDQVSIGVATADNALDVHSATGPAIISITSLGTDQDVALKFEFTDNLSTFILGVDDDDSDKFKIGTTALQTNTRLTIDSAGLIGIGTDSPNNLLDIHNASGDAALAITSIGADTDPVIKFELVDNVPTFTMGVDDSEGDHFAISAGGDISLFKRFVIDSAGFVGIGTADPDNTLHVQGTSGVSAEILVTTDTDNIAQTSTLAFSIPANDPQSGIRGTSRTAGAMDLALFVQSVSGAGNRFDALTILGLSGFVGIGDTTPTNVLDVQHATNDAAIAITALGASADPLIKFELVDTISTFVIGIDNSDVDNTRLTIDSAGNIGIGLTAPTTPLEVTGIIRITTNTSGQLQLGAQGATSEGGMVTFEGAGSNNDWFQDLFGTQMRFITDAVVPSVVRFFNTNANVAATMGLLVDDFFAVGSVALPDQHTMDIRGDLGLLVAESAGNVDSGKEVIIGITDTSGTPTVTLRSLDNTANRVYMIKDQSGNAGTNNITIATGGSETIDGDATLVIAADFGGVVLYSNGSNWFVLAKT